MTATPAIAKRPAWEYLEAALIARVVGDPVALVGLRGAAMSHACAYIVQLVDTWPVLRLDRLVPILTVALNVDFECGAIDPSFADACIDLAELAATTGSTT